MPMIQDKRSAYRLFINTKTTIGESYENAEWTLEGEGVEGLAIEYNPSSESFKPIIRDKADTTFTNYEISSDVSDKRCYKDDAMYKYLKPLAMKGEIASTQAVLVDTTEKGTADGSYKAFLSNIEIYMSSWLGENATISYEIHYNGDLVQGEVLIADGTVSSFTPAV